MAIVIGQINISDRNDYLFYIIMSESVCEINTSVITLKQGQTLWRTSKMQRFHLLFGYNFTFVN